MTTAIPEEGFDEALARYNARRLFWIRAFVVLFFTGGIVVVAFLLWILLEIKQTQEQGTPMGKAIQSCVDSKGKCYQNNQRTAREAISSVNDYTIFAIACGVNLVQGEQRPTASEVRECVEKAIAEETP